MAKTHSTSQIAKRYALALYQLAGSNASGLIGEIDALATIARQADVKEFFENPTFTRAEQVSAVKAILANQPFSKIVVDAVVGIANNRRLPLLLEIINQFKAMVMQAQNIEAVEIISAKTLNAADIQKLADHLANLYGKNIQATSVVDASLIGGIKLKMQDKLIDYSVAGKLDRLGQHLKTA